MTRRLRVECPGAPAFASGRRPLRILAVSDEPDPALANPANRSALAPVDLVVGCGDLEPDALAFVIDAFDAPSIHVRGNHDGGIGWAAGEHRLPAEAVTGVPVRMPGPDRGAGPVVIPLAWPGAQGARQRRDEGAAWRHVLGATVRCAMPGRGSGPLVVVSHAAPLGAGDATDDYHRGFRAYRWLMDRAHPVLWLHGHTPLAAAPWLVRCGATTLVNVTGSVLVELVQASPGSSGGSAGSGGSGGSAEGEAPPRE